MFSCLRRTFFAGVALLSLLAFVSGCAGNKTHKESFFYNSPPPISGSSTNARWEKAVPFTAYSDSSDTMATNILAWDSTVKESVARLNENESHFTFNLTNVSREELTIYEAASSCDCTVAKLPSSPWKLPPGGTGLIQVTVDLRDKEGTDTKDVIVFTSKGNRRLTVKTILPAPVGNVAR